MTAFSGTKAETDSADQANGGDTFHFRPDVAAQGMLDDIAAPGGGRTSDVAASLESLDPLLSHALEALAHASLRPPAPEADPQQDDAAGLAKLAQILGHHADV
jgi:hypothetical protein